MVAEYLSRNQYKFWNIPLFDYKDGQHCCLVLCAEGSKPITIDLYTVPSFDRNLIEFDFPKECESKSIIKIFTTKNIYAR